MVARGTFYGVVALLVAISLISSSFAVSYYGQLQQQESQSQRYSGELATALAQYRVLGSSYQTALDSLNRTIFLLSQALSGLNTTSPAYKEGTASLASIWKTYLGLTKVKGGSEQYSVNMLLQYGNGTKRWFNETATQPGWNAYTVTLVALNGSVQAAFYPSIGPHGDYFVTGIVGVNNAPSQNEAWLLWTWNSTQAWQLANTGPAEIPTYNGSVFAWTYCAYNPTTYAPLCTP